MLRSRAERRHLTWRQAIRKSNIVKHHGFEFYDNLHQYADNKIHCSCGICARYNKTNNKGHRRAIHGNYAPSINWKKSDQCKIDSMKSQLY